MELQAKFKVGKLSQELLFLSEVSCFLAGGVPKTTQVGKLVRSEGVLGLWGQLVLLNYLVPDYFECKWQ